MFILQPRTIKVYFSNGADAAQPWHVGECDGKAISEDCGQFTEAETAIIHAVELARVYQATLIVPAWLNHIALEIQSNDARYYGLRMNESIGQCEAERPFLF